MSDDTVIKARPIRPPIDIETHNRPRRRAADPRAEADGGLDLFRSLPPRVQEAALLRARGMPAKEAARKMGIGHRTLRMYVSRLIDASDATNVLEALVRLNVLVLHPDLRED